MAALVDACRHACHGYVLWEHEHVESDEVAGLLGLIDKRDLRWMREDGLGNELTAALDQR